MRIRQRLQELLKCEQIKLLPPLGQLCLLKELRIHGLGAVKTIGERLEIDEMSEWIEWSHGNMGGDQGFPNLQELITTSVKERDYTSTIMIENIISGSELQIIRQLGLFDYTRQVINQSEFKKPRSLRMSSLSKTQSKEFMEEFELAVD
ncbi:putative disease resistance RPP13-like protein 1 [Tripterygium wilfordii]|uniref:Putative disease resistance RPP13-like protein 1 n=1 Tax=Tripterygium wilfordii TaxID=458696 RepID=A0A7J7CI33_TRIWF|nr:putative disease resistance RPP13-like protein 1 [Tripterygium wilfordii]